MTRMERRRRRRRILRIKLATTAAVLALTTASIVALTGGAAETVPEPTPQPPALQAEPVLLVAEHDSTYQPVQMTTEPAQEPEPVEEEDENEKIEAALLEQGYLHEEIPLDFDLQCHLITVCEEYGVPQSVALGVIQAESSFTATASNGSCYDTSVCAGSAVQSVMETRITDMVMKSGKMASPQRSAAKRTKLQNLRAVADRLKRESTAEDRSAPKAESNKTIKGGTQK